MPELPEVEVTRRGIAGPLRGALVLATRLGKPLRWPLGVSPAALAGCTVGEVARRGKYLWLPLQATTRAAHGGLLLHLGMSGSLGWWPQAGEPGPHDHFDSRHRPRHAAPERSTAFRRRRLVRRAGPGACRDTAGPPGRRALRSAFSRRSLPRRAAAAAHTDQESCCWPAAWWWAPATSTPARRCSRPASTRRCAANRISRPRAERLLAALRGTLARALEVGGSTLRDFTDAHGVSRCLPGRSGGLWPSRAALPAMRRARATAGAGAAIHLLLCGLSARR
jgi:formamidopyrimidine-DNA glycosylase